MNSMSELTAMFFNINEDKKSMEKLARKLIETSKIEQNKMEMTKKLENIALLDISNIEYMQLFYEFLANRPSVDIKNKVADLIKSHLV